MMNLMQRTDTATVTLGLSGVPVGYLSTLHGPTSGRSASPAPVSPLAFVNLADTAVFEADRDRGICGEWTAFGDKHHHSQHSRPS